MSLAYEHNLTTSHSFNSIPPPHSHTRMYAYTHILPLSHTHTERASTSGSASHRETCHSRNAAALRSAHGGSDSICAAAATAPGQRHTCKTEHAAAFVNAAACDRSAHHAKWSSTYHRVQHVRRAPHSITDAARGQALSTGKAIQRSRATHAAAADNIQANPYKGTAQHM